MIKSGELEGKTIGSSEEKMGRSYKDWCENVGPGKIWKQIDNRQREVAGNMLDNKI